MTLHLRNPVFEVVDDHRVKIVTNGSLLQVILSVSLSIVVPVVFGLSAYVYSGVFIGILFFALLCFLMAPVVLMAIKTPKYLVCNIADKVVTKYPVLGQPTDSTLLVESLTVSKVKIGYSWRLNLELLFKNERIVVLRGLCNKLTEVTYNYVIYFLQECVNYSSVEKAQAITAKNINQYQFAFKEFYKPSLGKQFVFGLRKALLCVLSISLTLGVTIIVLAFIFMVFVE